MRSIKYFINFCLLIGFTFLAYSQTTDEIIDKYITAIGGLEKINSIQTIKYVKITTMTVYEDNTIIYIKKPDKVRTESRSPWDTLVCVYNGMNGWYQSRYVKKPMKLGDRNVKEINKISEFDQLLVNYKEEGYKVEFINIENVSESSAAYKLKLTTEDYTAFYFIDTITNYIIKTEKNSNLTENEINDIELFSDFNSEDGFIMPHKIEGITTFRGVTVRLPEIIKDVEINPQLNDDIFTIADDKK